MGCFKLPFNDQFFKKCSTGLKKLTKGKNFLFNFQMQLIESARRLVKPLLIHSDSKFFGRKFQGILNYFY